MIVRPENLARVKAVFSILDFLCFVKTKPPKEVYDYGDPFNCALAQYLTAKGFTGREFVFQCSDMNALYPGLHEALNPAGGEGTFGGLVQRLDHLAP